MNRNQYSILALCIVASTIVISACNSKSSSDTTTTSGNWRTRSEFNGPGRMGAAVFTIKDTAYVCTGFNGTLNQPDCFKYLIDLDTWAPIDSFPGVGRSGAVAFSANDKGYIVGGFDAVTGTYLKDVWEYNPAKKPSWTQKADFPGLPRQSAVGFAINNIGYLCSGMESSNSNLKDAWQYNAATDTWTAIESWGGSKRSGAVAFVYNNEGYVLTGFNNGAGVSDFYKFTPSSTAQNRWTKLRSITNIPDSSYNTDYTDIMRQYAVAFLVGTGDPVKAYISTGQGTSYTNKTWEYDFKTDQWSRKTDYEFSPRGRAIAFTLKGRGFVGLGGTTIPYDNFSEFEPSKAKVDGD